MMSDLCTKLQLYMTKYGIEWKKSFAFFIVLLIYLGIGGFLFMRVERKEEARIRKEINDFYREFIRNHSTVTIEDLNRLVLKVIKEKPFHDVTIDETDSTKKPRITWDYGTSFFFAITALTTIGYGIITPKTNSGQILFVMYAFYGLPLMGMNLSFMSNVHRHLFNYFKRKIQKCYPKWVPKNFRNTFTLACMWTGLGALFMLFPCLIFAWLEGWSYTEALYFSFVTTSTVGFGDYVPTSFSGYTFALQICFSIGFLLYLLVGLSYIAFLIEDIGKKQMQAVGKLGAKKEHRKRHIEGLLKETHSKSLFPTGSLRFDLLSKTRISVEKAPPLAETEDLDSWENALLPLTLDTPDSALSVEADLLLNKPLVPNSLIIAKLSQRRSIT